MFELRIDILHKQSSRPQTPNSHNKLQRPFASSNMWSKTTSTAASFSLSNFLSDSHTHFWKMQAVLTVLGILWKKKSQMKLGKFNKYHNHPICFSCTTFKMSANTQCHVHPTRISKLDSDGIQWATNEIARNCCQSSQNPVLCVRYFHATERKKRKNVVPPPPSEKTGVILHPKELSPITATSQGKVGR